MKDLKQMKCPECGERVKRDKRFKETYYCNNCDYYFSSSMVEDYNIIRKGEV